MARAAKPMIPTLPFSGMSDGEVREKLRALSLGLTAADVRRIIAMLGRDPTVVEAFIWNIQGSEHCSYRSSRKFLKGLPTESRHVILGPGEDSGIVAITDGPPGKRWGIVVSHESHNHPSQIVPFEGAATGIGGVVRDVVCMGARVVGCLDLLRFGDLRTDESRTIAKEVIRGIAGYGNPLGIPNLGGDTEFDAAYNGNCLVNAAALGIVREDEVIRSAVPEEAGTVGYDILLVGKPTDRSGFGGASFASAVMGHGNAEENTGAVQEPNPFLERHLLASTYALFDWLAATGNIGRVSFKDLGGGGIVCASVEQVATRGLGADMDLDRVHVAAPDLPSEVIACAETQERFCWICHPDLTAHILRHYNETWDLPRIAENARASIIGKVNAGDLYTLTHRGKVVCRARAQDITCGLAEDRPIAPAEAPRREPDIACVGGAITVRQSHAERGAERALPVQDAFLEIIAHPNNASKAPAIRQYDKNVIGITVIEPGEADAAVFAPLRDLRHFVHEGAHPGWELPEDDARRGVAVSVDGNGRYGRISPYWQGANAAVEAMRNVAAVGAVPRAITDCLNYGNPEDPSHLWALAEGIRGIADAVRGISFDGAHPAVISGNVSLYNARPDGSAIDPMATVCCIGVIPDAADAVTMQIREPGSSLYLIGERRDECGGSAYYQMLEEFCGFPRDALLGSNVPHPDFARAAEEMRFVTAAIGRRLVRACHDVSSGGLAVALFEMTLPQRKRGGDIGIDVDLGPLGNGMRSDALCFSETGGFVLDVSRSSTDAFERMARDFPVRATRIGQSRAGGTFVMRQGDTILIQETLQKCHSAWKTGLEQKLT